MCCIQKFKFNTAVKTAKLCKSDANVCKLHNYTCQWIHGVTLSTVVNARRDTAEQELVEIVTCGLVLPR